MTKSAVYYLAGAENSKLVISHDELRSLFNQIEAEFCQSDIYQKAFEGLQKRLGNAPKWVHLLIKAIGREAIRLTLRQVVNQFQAENSSLQPETHPQQDTQHPAASPQVASPQVASPQVASPQVASPQETSSPAFSSPTAYQATPHREQEPTGSASPAVPLSPPAHSTLEHIQADQTATPGNASQDKAPQWDQVPAGAPTPSRPPSITPPSPPPPSANINPFSKRKPQSTMTELRAQAYKDIGATLRQARLDKSLTVHQVHEETKVGIHQIEGIESGNLERLPEEIYVKGFIRQIARAVDVEYDTLMATLPQEPTKAADVPLRYLNVSSSSSRSVSVRSTSSGASSSRSLSSRGNMFRPAHLYIGYAALMASATGGLIWVNHSQSAAQLEGLDLPLGLPNIDLPEIFDDIKSRLNIGEPRQTPSRPQEQKSTPEAIAAPEVITVESSVTNHP